MNKYSIVKCINDASQSQNLTTVQFQKYNIFMEENKEIILYELSDFFKVMGDSTRIQLLWALEENEMCVNELAAKLNMTKSAVSHQLKVLRTAKLVRATKKGKNVYYALDDGHIKDILEKALEHVLE